MNENNTMIQKFPGVQTSPKNIFRRSGIKEFFLRFKVGIFKTNGRPKQLYHKKTALNITRAVF